MPSNLRLQDSLNPNKSSCVDYLFRQIYQTYCGLAHERSWRFYNSHNTDEI